jgi:hemerythrin superfamily protein
MDALALLHEDHVKVASLFDRYVQTKDLGERKLIVEQIRQELTAHASIEETLVYPALRELAPNKEAVGVAFEEHHLIEVVLCQIDKLEPGSEELSIKLGVLKNLVTKHVEIEESTLFDLATQVLGTNGLRELGKRIEGAKQEAQRLNPALRVSMAPEAPAPQTQERKG